MSSSDIQIAFIDTNVWLYAFVQGEDPSKHTVARGLLQRSEPIISTQVINEVCVNLLWKASFSEEQIGELIGSFYEKYHVVQLNRSILLDASGLRQRYSFSFWDSLIISSALQSNVSVLYSEDMHDGLLVDGRLRIVNPFVNGRVQQSV